MHDLERLSALVRTYGWRQSAGIIEMHRGLLAHIGDDLAGAERHYRAGADVLRRNGGLDVDGIAGIAAFSLAVTAGRPADLVPLLASFRPPPSEVLDMFAVVLAAAGRTEEALKITASLEAEPRIRRLNSGLPYIYGALGDRERALAFLEEGYEERVSTLVFICRAPELKSVYEEPRFAELLRRIGLPPLSLSAKS